MNGQRCAGLALTRRRLLAAAGAGLVAGRAEARPQASGTPFVWPDLVLADGLVLPATAWHDTAAVVVFWATWCGFCRRHNARMEGLHQASQGLALRVLGVCIDADADAARRYMQQHGFHFPVLAEQAALRGRFTDREIIPTTGLIDRRGLLRQVIPGEMAQADVMALAALARAG